MISKFCIYHLFTKAVHISTLVEPKQMKLGSVITNDKAPYVAKGDSICLFSIAKETALNKQWIKPCVPLLLEALHIWRQPPSGGGGQPVSVFFLTEGGGGLAVFWFFLTRGRGVQHILTFMTKSKNHAKIPGFLQLFSKYDKFSPFFFCLDYIFSLLLICVKKIPHTGDKASLDRCG